VKQQDETFNRKLLSHKKSSLGLLENSVAKSRMYSPNRSLYSDFSSVEGLNNQNTSKYKNKLDFSEFKRLLYVLAQ